jgi:hypothetical protein
MIAPNVAMYTGRMTNGSPPDLIKSETGFKLHRVLRQELDEKFGVHMSIVAVSKILADLPAKVLTSLSARSSTKLSGATKSRLTEQPS